MLTSLTSINTIPKSILRKEESWALLPREIREQLYALLPDPRQEGEEPYDPDVHPLHTRSKPYIEEEIRRFRDDLKDGREQKKWRVEAMQAGKDRLEGKFDEWKEREREEYWGKSKKDGDENLETKDQRMNGNEGFEEVKGDGTAESPMEM